MMAVIGPRTLSMAKTWLASGAVFGATAGLTFLYFSDWKLVNQYIPVYNTKFKEEE